jgi:hypothetical protein
MNIVKIMFDNKIEDEFLTNSLMLYIQRKIAEKFIMNLIIDDFRDLKERKFSF